MWKTKMWVRRLHRDGDGQRCISGDEDAKDQPAVFLMYWLAMNLNVSEGCSWWLENLYRVESASQLRKAPKRDMFYTDFTYLAMNQVTQRLAIILLSGGETGCGPRDTFMLRRLGAWRNADKQYSWNSTWKDLCKSTVSTLFGQTSQQWSLPQITHIEHETGQFKRRNSGDLNNVIFSTWVVTGGAPRL